MRKPIADKVLVLGIDGMDPRLTERFVKEGSMPNTKKFLEQGSARADLMMLGGQPTVTPPMWTTLATGCYPMVHNVTCFSRQSPTDLDVSVYNLDSRNCTAEQLWNVTAEAGLKTLVWHWPGSSWPPTSDSPNLHVVDGTQPGVVNMGVGQVDVEFILVGDSRNESVTYQEKAASAGHVPCVITDLTVDEKQCDMSSMVTSGKDIHNIILSEKDDGIDLTQTPFDVVLSSVKPAHGWANAPEDAKEFIMLFSKGLVRRPALILKNEQGIYDHIAIYKSKKETEPLVTLMKDTFSDAIVDKAIKNDQQYNVARWIRILELNEDGTHIKIWISAAMDIENDSVWHPKSLYKKVIDIAGYTPPESNLGGSDKQLVMDCMHECWEVAANWQAKALNYLIEEEKYDVIFSHFHNVDAHGHMIWRFLKDKGDAKLPHEEYVKMVEEVYAQTDRYIGKFMHLLDEGWTILIVSDHAQVSAEHDRPLICSGGGTSIPVMQELGFTYVKHDENGNPLHEIDWSRTRAVNNRSCHIYINLKGRDKHGIVDPKDKYKLEDEIITALYNYKHPVTGERVISIAMRNRDATLIGLGGDYPQCGDIIFFTKEGYNGDHCDSLSTTLGYEDTSVSPIFMAAGKGIKQNYVTKRWIREVDVAPTVAFLTGVRVPAQCEGAPAYQIFDQDI